MSVQVFQIPVKISHADFLTSVPANGRLPDSLGPTVAMIGRSNVGKSSLINALTGQTIARAGATPGTTRLINIYSVGLSWTSRQKPIRMTFADLPGYGFARGGLKTRLEFDAMTEEFFNQFSQQNTSSNKVTNWLSGIILVLDGRHPGLEIDLATYEWLEDNQLSTIVVTTKNDRMTRNEQAKTNKQHALALGRTAIASSSRSGLGIREIWTSIKGLI